MFFTNTLLPFSNIKNSLIKKIGKNKKKNKPKKKVKNKSTDINKEKKINFNKKTTVPGKPIIINTLNK